MSQTQIAHGQRLHGKLSGSKWDRVEACPGSVTTYGHLEDPSSEYAEEGTRAHEALEYWLKHDKPPVGLDRTVELSLSHYIHWIKSVQASGGLLYSEQALQHSEYPFATGTLDVGLVNPGNWLIISDLKWGAGVPVDAVKNDQLAFYASLFDPNGFYDRALTFVIYQPRLGGFKSWAVDPKYMEDVRSRITKAARSLVRGDTKLEEGDHCRWCPAKTVCPLKAQGFADVELAAAFGETSVKTRTDEEFSGLYKRVEGVSMFISAVKAEAKRRASDGRLPGYKLVQGEGHRAWAYPEAEIIEALTGRGLQPDDCYDHTLISPAVAEQRLGPISKAAIAQLVTRPASKTVSIVPVGNPGKPVSLAGSAAVTFGAE